MPIDLARLLDPAHTALVTSEIQRGVAGDLSALPELAKAAEPVLENIGRLCDAAHSAGVQVIHCTAERRADAVGANTNARLFQYMAKLEPMLPGSDRTQIVPQVRVEGADLVLPRLHGISPFQGTELDFVLRNLGITTILATGVSVNVAIQALTFDAVNASYQVVIPRDAVAGTPPEYAEQVFEHTLRNVATLVEVADVVEAWAR